MGLNKARKCNAEADKEINLTTCALRWLLYSFGARGGTVVEALRYKPEGRGIDSRWGQNFSLT
jgi:hypothetical protein